MIPGLGLSIRSRWRGEGIAFTVGFVCLLLGAPVFGDTPNATGAIHTTFTDATGSDVTANLDWHLPATALGTLDPTCTEVLLTGSLWRRGSEIQTFRYRLAIDPAAAAPVVSFMRTVPPGRYRLDVALFGCSSRRLLRAEHLLWIPADGAWAAMGSGQTLPASPARIEIVDPVAPKAGRTTITVQTHGRDIAQVRLLHDGVVVGESTIEPTSGAAPTVATFPLRLRRGAAGGWLTAHALATDGSLLAQDRRRWDAGPRPFRIVLAEPSKAEPGAFPARVDVWPPSGRSVERVELYVDRRLRATLFQPPYTHRLTDLPAGPYAVAAVAYLDDGRRAEDVWLANTTVTAEAVEVHDVELWVGAFDRRNRSAVDLTAAHFSVRENGVPQAIERFAHAADHPLDIGILLDVSPTMERDGALEEARRRAVTFFDEVVRPGDRAGLLTFREQPEVVVPFGAEPAVLRHALAGVEPDRSWVGTAVLDSVVASLPQFDGAGGRNALIVITDGLDNRSRLALDEVIRRVRRANVRVYTILVGRRALGPELTDLSRETGGTSHRLRHPIDMGRVYRQIARDLRSQYVVGYRSTWAGHDQACREIDVAIVRDQRPLTARTVRGYCP